MSKTAGITNDLAQKSGDPPGGGSRGVPGRFPPGQHCWSTRYAFDICIANYQQKITLIFPAVIASHIYRSFEHSNYVLLHN